MPMNKRLIIKKTMEHVRKKMEDDRSGHDWWHVYRVWRAAVHIGKKEKADLFVVQLGALLHDIADWKLHGNDMAVGPRVAREWLELLDLDGETVSHVCDIIANTSFKGAGVKNRIRTKEGMVVQDADRLDAIGAIGIARAFVYGGMKGRIMHDPGVKPQPNQTFAAYKRDKGTTINHFYEKLLLVKDRMNTKTAKEMAHGRHAFMERYLERFYNEWEGKD
ncbi:HD domain protein [uncultured archaeon]|nr:HD domain protein [uncultured archaeon]